jgi:hypothetical protein
MENYFLILNNRIELIYQDRQYAFDLNDGDIDDYWDSFTYNGKELNINYFPVLDSLTIYTECDEMGQIDTSQFETAEFVGDLTDKYIIVDAAKYYLSDDYEKRYKDSNDIIIYENYLEAISNIGIPLGAVVLISNMSFETLMKVFKQKINDYERDNLRRGA